MNLRLYLAHCQIEPIKKMMERNWIYFEEGAYLDFEKFRSKHRRINPFWLVLILSDESEEKIMEFFDELILLGFDPRWEVRYESYLPLTVARSKNFLRVEELLKEGMSFHKISSSYGTF